MIPAARQRVRLRGVEGNVFLVISVERDLQCAYVTPVDGPEELFWVPFDRIEPDHPTLGPRSANGMPERQRGDSVA